MKLSVSFLALALAASRVSAGPVEDAINNLKLPVSSTALQLLIWERGVMSHMEKISELTLANGGNRAFGSVGHNVTVDYIAQKLQRTGYYNVERQTFAYPFSEGEATLSVNGADIETSWPTYGPAGDVEKPMYRVANFGCDASDFPATVAGNIALIKRGTCEFGHKVALAGAAGAAGAILFNNVPALLSSVTLGAPSRPDVGPYVPVSGISGTDGEAFSEQLAAGTEVIGNLQVDAETGERFSTNILATTKYGDKDNIVFAGAHTDGAPEGPGMSDNGSGTASLLEVALKLPAFKVKNAVRFGFWTAEEVGLVGAEHYVTTLSAEERQKIALYLNFDMVASPNFVYAVYNGDGTAFPEIGGGPPGSEHIEATFKEWFSKKRLGSVPTAFDGRSDYGPFLDAGIPAGGLFTGAEGVMSEEEAKMFGGQANVAYDPCYHTPCDNMDNINRIPLLQNTRATAHAIATYARSVNGIPRDRPEPTTARKASRSGKLTCGKEHLAI